MFPCPGIGRASAGLSQARRGQGRLDSARLGWLNSIRLGLDTAWLWFHLAWLGLAELGSFRHGSAWLRTACFNAPAWSAMSNYFYRLPPAAGFLRLLDGSMAGCYFVVFFAAKILPLKKALLDPSWILF